MTIARVKTGHVAGSVGAAISAEVAGRSVILQYGNVADEYERLRTGAGLLDRSHRGRLTLQGPKAAPALGGLVTNDVESLAPGQGEYAAALTAKGKIVADVRIFARDGSLLVDAPARAADAWLAMVRKFVNPRLAKHEDVSASTRCIGVFGPRARHHLDEVMGINSSALAILPQYSHVEATVDGASVTVARVPDIGLEGFDLFVPADSFDALWKGLLYVGATPVGLDAWDIARVEAGRPEWGIDIDDTTIPQEANFDELHAVSYTKGCYIGQEIVARVHFRGHVNRLMRGLRFGTGALPPIKAQLIDHTDKVVGDVRSGVDSPRLGPIALGMVRREVELGTVLPVRWDGGEATATVVALPF